MAQATVTLKVYPFPYGKDVSDRRVSYSGQAIVQAAAATYTTGGLGTLTSGSLNWQSMTDQTTGEVVIVETATQTQPIMVYFTSVGGSGFVYGWNKSTNKFQIFTTGTATQSGLAELTSGSAIPAGVSGDVIEFDADFAKAL